MKYRLVSAVIATAGAATLLAQEPIRPPTFTSKGELVIVDAVVTDAKGRIVRGLSMDDFVVKENGRPRRIVAFEAFAGDDPTVPPTRSRALGASVRLSSQPVRAATVLLVDDGQLSPDQAMKLRPALKTLLTKLGEPSDTVMLVAPLSKISVAGRLPGDAEALTAAVDRIVGRRFEDFSRFPVAEAEAFAIDRGDRLALARVTARFAALNPDLSQTAAGSLARLRATEVAQEARARRDASLGMAGLCLDWLANQSGRRNLIVVSGGFAADPGDSKYRGMVTRSLKVNTPIHFLDARGIQGWGHYNSLQYGPALGSDATAEPGAWVDAVAGSRGLAADTGGLSLANVGDMTEGLRQVFLGMTNYYLLAYEPPEARSGFRKISVEVRVKGAKVRARRGYYVE